jgi:hypothetical protein
MKIRLWASHHLYRIHLRYSMSVFNCVGAIANIRGSGSVPTGFIVTGPNIASQDLLFQQLSERLKAEINGPVVTLRSGGASNLKASLKQLIRDATNQRLNDEGEGVLYDKDVRLAPLLRISIR